MSEKQTTSRRDALRKMFRSAGVFTFGGFGWGAYTSKAKASELVLRPPGALEEKDFLNSCIKCGICVENCPYDTLLLAKPESEIPIGTPYFKPRSIPCYMCPDVPCVPPCPTGALDINKLVSDSGTGEKPDINKSLMGLAVVDQESCIAFWGIQCDACYRACPLMDEAISLVYERNERTGKHAFLKPEVHSKACTGCGMCEHACITEKAAIRILPRDVAMGKVGDHYIKGWDEEDEQRLQNIMEAKDEPSDEVPAEDYLNNWEDLIDE